MFQEHKSWGLMYTQMCITSSTSKRKRIWAAGCESRNPSYTLESPRRDDTLSWNHHLPPARHECQSNPKKSSIDACEDWTETMSRSEGDPCFFSQRCGVRRMKMSYAPHLSCWWGWARCGATAWQLPADSDQFYIRRYLDDGNWSSRQIWEI
jgi:hypothetical protein